MRDPKLRPVSRRTFRLSEAHCGNAYPYPSSTETFGAGGDVLS